MELERLKRIIGARWGVLLIAAVAAAIVAAIGSAQRNARVQPEVLATSVVEFERLPLDTAGEERANRVRQAETRALTETTELILEVPNGAIGADYDLGELYFIATGPDATAAADNAKVLRDAFLRSERENIQEALAEELVELERRIVDRQRELNDLLERSADQIQAEEDLASVTAQIASLEAIATQLRVELVVPTGERTADEVRRVLATVEGQIEQLRSDADDFQAQAVGDDPVRTEIRVRALTAQIANLEELYNQTFLRQTGLAGGAQIGRIILESAVPFTLTVPSAAVLGVFAGLIFGFGALIASERSRPMVWMANDVRTLPSLGLVPSRVEHDGVVWYTEESGGPRKSAIQRVRAVLETRLGLSKIIGLASISQEDEQLAFLGVDIAASLSVTGRRVLVVDPTSQGTGGEYLHTTLTIAELLGEERITDRVLARAEIGDGLYVVTAGKAPLDADQAAGAAFRLLLDRLRSKFDALIVIAGSADSTVGQSLIQQTDRTVLAARPGKISEADLAAFTDDLQERGITLAGLAIVGSSTYRSADATPVSTSRRTSGSGGRRNTERGRRRVHGDAPVVDGAESETGDRGRHRVGTSEQDELILNLIDTLEESEPYRVVDAIEQYLADRLSVIVTEVAGAFDRGDKVEPFLWLGPRSTAEERLRSDLVSDLPPGEGNALIEALLDVLKRSLGLHTLNDWILDRFFMTHVRESDGDPRVWSLTEGDGGFAALVDGDRLRVDHLEAVRSRVRSAIGSLESDMRKLPRDERERAEEMVEHMQVFDLKLGLLYEGRAPEARIHYPGIADDQQPTGWDPDFSVGRAPHLAPIQRLGLLPQPVLSDTAMNRFVPA